MKHIVVILMIIALFCLSGCKERVTKTVSKQAFTVPEPPVMLITPEQRNEFMATHYWDNFNFSDTTLIHRADITEQAFANFISLLSVDATQSVIEKSIDTLMTRASADSTMYAHFIELSEKYLYDPNSPLRDEEVYIVILNSIVNNPVLDEIAKTRPRYQLAMVLRNRVAQQATDFTYTTPSGAHKRLFQAKGDYIILFFFEPDCPDCARVKKYISDNRIADIATIVMVNPDKVSGIDSLYDVRASPLLYLLDKDKKVLLKDTPVEQIKSYLTRHILNSK